MPEPTPEPLADVAAAFTEWERRFREEPDRFQSEASRVLTTTPETYGAEVAPYFLKIIAEIRVAKQASAN